MQAHSAYHIHAPLYAYIRAKLYFAVYVNNDNGPDECVQDVLDWYGGCQMMEAQCTIHILTAVMDERGTNSCTAAGALFLPVEAVAHRLTASAKLPLRKHMPDAD